MRKISLLTLAALLPLSGCAAYRTMRFSQGYRVGLKDYTREQKDGVTNSWAAGYMVGYATGKLIHRIDTYEGSK